MARPYKTNSKQTPELEARILKCICDGMSLNSICKLDGIPPRETIHRWIKRDPDFSRRYDEAREERGNFYGEKVAEIASDVLDGKIDYNIGRVAGGLLQWTAARMSPKNFGDRMQVEHGVEETLVDALKNVQMKVVEEDKHKLPSQLHTRERKQIKKAMLG
tara:strand:+ start:1792 stop:2274 length:483 start_codon:yes stop_codon:yes gene_type:complete